MKLKWGLGDVFWRCQLCGEVPEPVTARGNITIGTRGTKQRRNTIRFVLFSIQSVNPQRKPAVQCDSLLPRLTPPSEEVRENHYFCLRSLL